MLFVYRGQKFNTVEWLKAAIINEWQKLLQRFIDSRFNEWCRGFESRKK